ncbi:hypothetical protein YC2023_094524 [Brassica napus]
MKPTFYFLLALTVVLAATASPGDPVLDIDGNIIFNGNYYVLPRMVGTGGGGLTLSILPSKWWLYVAHETSEANRGFPRGSTVKFVPESAHINIQMVVNATVTTRPTYWTLNIPLKILEAGVVAVGPKPLSHYFQIQKIEDSFGGYKIVFCWSSGSCTDLGIHRTGMAFRVCNLALRHTRLCS